MKSTVRVIIVVVTVVVPMMVGFAQEGASRPVVVWSSGQLEADNSVFYSVFLMSGAGGLDTVTVRSTIPQGATFGGAFWQPEGASFVGETEGIVTWELSHLPAVTALGPFTYWVTFEEGSAAPHDVAAQVTWGDQSLGIEATPDAFLQAFEDSGTLRVSPEGTEEYLPIGETGMWIFVPAGAVAETVVLTFTRLPISDEVVPPDVAEETWWCTLVQITTDRAVEFRLPIHLFVTTRRALPPLAEVAVFAQPATEEWSMLSAEGSDRAYAVVAFVGTYASVTLYEFGLDGDGQTVALGIGTQERAIGANAVTNLIDPDPDLLGDALIDPGSDHLVNPNSIVNRLIDPDGDHRR